MFICYSKYDGASWCFLGNTNNACTDKTSSKSLPGKYWSIDACYTPLQTSSKCSITESTSSIDETKEVNDSCAKTGETCTQSTDCCNGYQATVPSCGVVCEQGKCGTAILCNR